MRLQSSSMRKFMPIMFHGGVAPIVPDACDDPSVALVTEGAVAARSGDR